MTSAAAVGNSSSFICPDPLVYAHGSSHTTFWVYENCVVPCPTVTFTEAEWELQLDLFMYVLICAFIVTIIMLVRMARRYFIRTMFIAGFIVYSVVLLIFLGLNANNGVVCEGDAHYVKQAPFCVFQASVTIFSIIWVQVWSVIMAYDSYLHINTKVTKVKMESLRRQYFIIAFCTSFVCAFIPLVAGNLGFDPKANIPMCLYLFSDNSIYFWTTLFTPFCLLNLLCLYITIVCVIKIQRVLVMSRHSSITRGSSNDSDEIGPSSAGSESRLSGSSASSWDRPGHRREPDHDTVPFLHRQGSPEEEDDHAAYAGHVISPSSSPGYDYGFHANITNPLLGRRSSASLESHEDGHDDDLEYDSDYVRHSEESFRSAEEEDDSGSARHNSQDYSSNSNSEGNLQLKEIESPIDPGFLTNVTEVVSPNTQRWEAMFSGSRNAQSPETDDDIQTRPYATSDADSVSRRWTERYNSELWNKFVSLGIFGDWRVVGGEIVNTRGRKISNFEFLIRKTLKYNGRTILFLLTFCVTTLFVAPLLIYMNLIEYDKYDQSGEDFLDCLVVASLHCPEQTQEAVDACGLSSCGTHQKLRPAGGMLTMIVIWIAGYGIIPGIVFGAYG